MGTFRAMDETWRFQAHKLIHQICKGIAQGMGAEIDVLVDVGYPVVNNDENLYPVSKKKSRRIHRQGKCAGNRSPYGLRGFRILYTGNSRIVFTGSA